MAKNRIKFSIFELTDQVGRPSVDDLASILESQFIYEHSKFTYNVTTEVIKEYFWISIGYGAAQPRASHLIDNSQKHSLVENTRTEDQVEPNQQLFCIYDPARGDIYISDSRKFGFVNTMLNEHGETVFFIKRSIVNPEEFLRTLKIVDGMAIAAKTDLITQSGNLFESVKDLFGYGAPEQFYIRADYGMPFLDKFKNQFRFFYGEFKEKRLTKFTCIGKDDSGLETVFNADSLTKAIVVKADMPENGLYRHEDVRDELVTQLNKYE